MHHIVKLSAWHGSAAAHNADLLRDSERVNHHRDGVGVLEIEDPRCAVGERVRVGLAGRDAAVGIEPLDCTRYVRELSASLAVGVELGAVGNDQTLIRANRTGRGEHGQRELAGGRTRVADRKISARDQRSLARNRRDAVRLENLRAEYLRCRGTRAAAIAFGEPIKERDIPCIARAGILDVERKLPPLPQAHRCRSRLGHHQIRSDDGHRRRDSPLARQGLVEDAVDEPAKFPLRRVEELRARGVRRGIVKDNCDIDDDLLSGRDNRKVAGGEHTADVRE